jgi:hypothetical protein
VWLTPNYELAGVLVENFQSLQPNGTTADLQIISRISRRWPGSLSVQFPVPGTAHAIVVPVRIATVLDGRRPPLNHGWRWTIPSLPHRA